MCALITLLAEGNRLAWCMSLLFGVPGVLLWLVIWYKQRGKPKRKPRLSEHWNDADIEDAIFWLLHDDE